MSVYESLCPVMSAGQIRSGTVLCKDLLFSQANCEPSLQQTAAGAASAPIEGGGGSAQKPISPSECALCSK